ncbi:MAG: hypothetical protein K2N89_03270 [Lachnospiraceae bacterium]|nr:hypothetical protein [Lachnospiraceae bacterium]
MEVNKEWMNDPALEGIDKAKLSFLEKLFVQSTSIDMTNQKEMLPFLLSLSKLSRENNISFDKSEFALIYSVLQKYSSKEDIAKMEKLSSAFRFR